MIEIYEVNGRRFTIKENTKSWSVKCGVDKFSIHLNFKKKDYSSIDDVKKEVSKMFGGSEGGR